MRTRFVLFAKLILAGAFRDIRGPIIEIDLGKVYDRMANKIVNHELLEVFSMNETDSAEFYCRYNNRIFQKQNSQWLIKFLGYAKNISYWVTPWGGCAKDHSKKERLTIKHADEYVKRLKFIKDLIVTKGYHPEKYGYITGQLVENKNGDKRFIIWNGHRRMLSLASLNYKKIMVEISGGDRWDGKIRNNHIKMSNLKKWKNVKNKIFTEKEAMSFINAYFK